MKRGSRLRYVLLLIITALLLPAGGCNEKPPCRVCGAPSTGWGYSNELAGERQYFCSDCATQCACCHGTATRYFTAKAGNIVFICNECYYEE